MERFGVTAFLACSVLSMALAQPGQPTKPSGLPAGHPTVPLQTETFKAKARPEDVKSIDAILGAMYEATSGGPQRPVDWERLWSLFSPDARLIAARETPEGGAWAMVLTAANYQDVNKGYFDKGGHYDKEIARRSETFGKITHVWSTFESRHAQDEPDPYVRGVNSIQLLKDKDRWWIVNVFWELEGPGTTIPDEYLKTPSK